MVLTMYQILFFLHKKNQGWGQENQYYYTWLMLSTWYEKKRFGETNVRRFKTYIPPLRKVKFRQI